MRVRCARAVCEVEGAERLSEQVLSTFNCAASGSPKRMSDSLMLIFSSAVQRAVPRTSANS